MLLVKCKCGHEFKIAGDGEDPSACPECESTIVPGLSGAHGPKSDPPIRPAPMKSARQQSAPVNPAPVNPAQVMMGGVGLDKKRIGELMVADGVISSAQLAHALDMQRRKGSKVVESLIALSYLTVEDFVAFLSRQPGVASIDLAHYKIPADVIDLIPKELAIRHEIFPIDRMGKLLTIGMACPLDSTTMRRIEEISGLQVKALLCAAEDIRKAIRQYYPIDDDDFDAIVNTNYAPNGAKRSASKVAAAKSTPIPIDPKVETGLKLSRASILIRELKALPALPATVEDIREAMHDISVSPNEVAEIILQDPPIAANVLGVANSSAYGFSHQVTTVRLAVALMGLRETYSIVLSAAVLNLFDKSSQFDYKRYWEESMNCAAAAKIIAKACGREQDQGVFTAGLLHDIGRVALLETVPTIYAQVPTDLTGAELIAAEERIVGLSHAEAGYELATNWDLPTEIAEPIRFHHNPEFATEAVASVCMVSLAEEWTRVNAAHPTPNESQLREWTKSFRILGLDAATAAGAYEEAARLDKIRFDWSAQEKATSTGESPAK